MAQIKKDTSLRKAILQAAITGQLISTCHSELDSESAETGKELLDRIIEERMSKEKMPRGLDFANAKSGKKKAKKETALAGSNPCGNIPEEEIPFEIPENWCWCRLEDLVTILGDGLHGTPQYDISGEYYFVNGNNLNNGLIEIKPDTKKVNKKEFEKYKKELNDTTIFISINGTIGNIAFYNDEKIILGKSACYFNVAIKELKNYFFYLFQSDYFLTYALDNATGTTIKNVGLGTMRNFLLPLPPLAVQNAIVAKLEQVLPLMDVYENALLQKEELKSELPDKVKKAILQEAITGQITEAWRKSATIKESGKQLLDRIIEERNANALAEWEESLKKNPKAKKPVPVVASEIEEEDIPFEVPESWCWVKGKNIFAQMESIKPQGETFTYIDTDAVNNKLNIIDNPKTLLVKEAPSRASRKLHKGDVLFSMVRPYLKNIAFVEDIFADAIASTGFYVMTQIGMYNPKFLYYMVLSPYVIDGLHYFMKGDNSPSINTTDIDNFVYPLPPLEEQEEIVKKVEELLPLCK